MCVTYCVKPTTYNLLFARFKQVRQSDTTIVFTQKAITFAPYLIKLTLLTLFAITWIHAAVSGA